MNGRITRLRIDAEGTGPEDAKAALDAMTAVTLDAINDPLKLRPRALDGAIKVEGDFGWIAQPPEDVLTSGARKDGAAFYTGRRVLRLEYRDADPPAEANLIGTAYVKVEPDLSGFRKQVEGAMGRFLTDEQRLRLLELDARLEGGVGVIRGENGVWTVRTAWANEAGTVGTLVSADGATLALALSGLEQALAEAEQELGGADDAPDAA